MIGLLQSAMLGLMVLVGAKLELGLYYYLGVVAGSLVFLRQQYLIRKRDPDGCFRAFIGNNYFGMAVFIGLVVDYLVSR